MYKKIPNYIKYIFTNIFLLFVFALIFRALFYLFFANLENAATQEIQKALWLGIRFDLKLAVLIFFPFAILILILNFRFFQKPVYKRIASIYIVLAYLVLTLFYLTDFGYYDYLATRLDASSLRFLGDLKISGQVLIESYPVYKGLFGLVILCFIIYKFAAFTFNLFSKTLQQITLKLKAFYIISTVLLLSFLVYSSTTHYPLRWSEAFFSKNNKVNQFALNPVLYFFDSFAFRSEGVDIEKFKAHYTSIANHLNLPKDRISFERKVTFDTLFTKKPNIVFVMLESLGVAGMSAHKNPIETTPKLDTLLKESTYFSNFYVHKSGTAATVFSSITGLPDIEEVKTASRNPMIIDQRILFDQFNGYEKLYFLGGSANWANIRGIFKANINGLKIFEEGSYDTENRADVWGIDDYELFKESNKELENLHKQEKPFVAYIQTASNHIPFTVPDKKESYVPLKEAAVSKKLLDASGFKSVAQLNALRYLDFNIDVFLKRAKKAGYYDNTIFVFFGDHNTAMNSTTRFTKEYDLNIQLQHVPLVIHGPRFVKNEEITKNGMLVDLFPTVASLAKIAYTNYTLGSDLLDAKTKGGSFIYHIIKGEPAIGFLKDSLYYSKTNVTNSTNLYNLKGGELINIKEKHPVISSKMDSLVKAFYHSTKYLYFNNKKLAK
jgi:phosphoglycerol transferase MdoB-like AlkP superfamily enzyme